jgi:hypothetical protein
MASDARPGDVHMALVSAAMTEEAPRLYSRTRRQPVDVVAEQHLVVHGWLERWGAADRGGAGAGTCSSAEGDYDSGAGGRENKRPIIALPPNPIYPRITRAVWHMPMQQGETVRLFYVKRRSPMKICEIMVLRWEGFPAWMFACRSMVLNLLRLDGVMLG